MSKSEYKERHCFSLKEFCFRNGIGRTTAYKEIKAGRLHTKKVGRRTLILRAEEQRWLAQDVLMHGERPHD
jgi:excisionase family DNA binding protein